MPVPTTQDVLIPVIKTAAVPTVIVWSRILENAYTVGITSSHHSKIQPCDQLVLSKQSSWVNT